MVRKEAYKVYYNVNANNPFMVICDKNDIIVNAFGDFRKYFRLHNSFTRKSPIRNEPRLAEVKTISGITVYKQLAYNKAPHNLRDEANKSKNSNTPALLKREELNLQGLHFFKHSVNHFLKTQREGYQKHKIVL